MSEIVGQIKSMKTHKKRGIFGDYSDGMRYCTNKKILFNITNRVKFLLFRILLYTDIFME